MSKFLSTKYSDGSFNFGMLVLRVFTGLLIVSHGYSKLTAFTTLRYKFMNFMGLGSTMSLTLIIFAEVICGAFIVMGLFTRLACIPPIIGMCVVVFMSSHGNIFNAGEKGTLYLVSFIAILFCGPGKISVDGMMGK